MQAVKYKNGEKITSMAQFEALCDETYYFRLKDKTVPKGQIFNMLYRQVKNCIDRGQIYTIAPNDDE